MLTVVPTEKKNKGGKAYFFKMKIQKKERKKISISSDDLLISFT